MHHDACLLRVIGVPDAGCVILRRRDQFLAVAGKHNILYRIMVTHHRADQSTRRSVPQPSSSITGGRRYAAAIR